MIRYYLTASHRLIAKMKRLDLRRISRDLGLLIVTVIIITCLLMGLKIMPPRIFFYILTVVGAIFTLLFAVSLASEKHD